MTHPVRFGFYTLLFASLMFAAGCAKKDTVQPGAGEGGASTTSPADTSGVAPGDSLSGDALDEPAAEDRRVYFAFDSDAIDAAGRTVVEANAKAIRAKSGAKVVIEGNCDERGTREYNLALGERRAKAVARMMQALGVPASQITVVSFGEEKPIDTGHDEAAWRANRRGDIKY
jgi:peptidoglycan-associated lipoprotein